MVKVFASHNSIISNFGFSTKSAVDAVRNEQSGLHKIEDKALCPEPFYTSLIDKALLKEEFSKLQTRKAYTRLERLMLLAIHEVLSKGNYKITNRTGLIISTTKGSIDVLENESAFPKERAYLGSLAKELKAYFGFKDDPVVVSNACVSGILAVATAKKFINLGVYDDVIVVAGDLVTEFIISGFNALQAMSKTLCRPYDVQRKGINIGEVVACLMITNNGNHLPQEAVSILGEASCNDANHISGPSRTGEGLYRSVAKALQEANITAKEIDYISAHGTATSFNDEMEAIAFNRLHLQKAPLNSLKGYFGHSLGASALVETIIGMHSLLQNTLFRSLGFQETGTSQPLNIVTKTTNKELNIFLKTASGFGGSNTAAIFKKVIS